MNATDAPIQVSSYTPTELSYLLAGRDNVEARRARSVLGLAEMQEGDPELLLAVQSLASRGLVSVTEHVVEISGPAKVLGYVLGTATDWTRLIVQADARVDAVVVITSPEVPGSLALRATSLGNYEAVATQPGVHPSQITAAMVTATPQTSAVCSSWSTPAARRSGPSHSAPPCPAQKTCRTAPPRPSTRRPSTRTSSTCSPDRAVHPPEPCGAASSIPIATEPQNGPR
jgi:hypothetical protein